MQRIRTSGRAAWFGLTIGLTSVLAGCGSPPPPGYQGKQGFRFTPPPGWVERDRDDLLPKAARKPADLPLPALVAPGEHMLVRYDRVTAGRLAWVRVSAADVPVARSVNDCVSERSPQPDWKPELAVENLEVGGKPAARAAFAGRWKDQEFISETVAVRDGEQVYFITASFPASDTTAREQAREAIARATWK